MKQTTDKMKCIAEQMVYGDLKFWHEENEKVGAYPFGKNLLRWRDIINSDEKLILRPLLWLTMEITHKGYNNDKPFVPLVELSKIHFPYCNVFEMKINWVNCGKIIDGNRTMMHGYTEDMYAVWLNERDMLNQWHFDTRGLISIGEAVSTEDTGDVYAVK